MRLLAMAADRVLSTVVPRVNASACRVCETYRVTCECSSYKDQLVWWDKNCHRDGCLCTGAQQCGGCFPTVYTCS